MDDRINLQVGERFFTTSRDTLKTRTRYFGTMWSGTWGDVQPKDSYFLDADGDAFAHVLRFLRHGTFPLLYDAATETHAYAMYGVILEQAKMLGIDDLQNWLEDKGYHEAMRTEYIKIAETTGFGHQIPHGLGYFKPTDMVIWGPGDDPEGRMVRKVKKDEPLYQRTTYNHRACLAHVDTEDDGRKWPARPRKDRRRNKKANDIQSEDQDEAQNAG
jgi:BTB/POZ domain